MAAIGLYGVYYALCTMTNGVVTGYGGAKTMGKAISANFTPTDGGGNDLYANNGVAETDGAVPSGGDLTVGLDRLKATAIVDLFGLTQETESITVGGETVTATGFNYTGEETANPVGVAFIRQKQEDNNRGIHEAIIYSCVTFKMPAEDASTLAESVEWQTPEIEGTIAGASTTGTYPWKKSFTFDSQADAIAFIEDYFSA